MGRGRGGDVTMSQSIFMLLSAYIRRPPPPSPRGQGSLMGNNKESRRRRRRKENWGTGMEREGGGKQERENCQVSSEPAVEKSSTKMGFGHVEMGPLTHDCLRTV